MVWRMGWVGGWLGLLASVFVVLLFQIQKNFKKSERRLSFRLSDPGEPPQPEGAGGSG